MDAMSPTAPDPVARFILLLAGVGTLCLAAAQAVMPFSRDLVRAFDGPDEWSAALLFASSFAVAGVLALIALYPFAGAGLLRRRPPFLLTVLGVVGAGFLLRGLSLPFQLARALGPGSAADVGWADIVASAATFDLGITYLVGLALVWRTVRAPRPATS
jgi:hypothetical protein